MQGEKNKKSTLMITVFFVVLIGFSLNVSASSVSVEIDEIQLLDISRTWEDVSLLYDNFFHDSAELDQEINRFHDLAPDIIDLEVIGQSYLGKNLTALRITNELRTQQKAKALVVAQHHGREQITVEIALRFIIYLLNNYQVNETITNYIDNQEIYVIPTLNPDALDIVVNEGNHWLRKNVRPWDDDNDTFFDEDPREDVTGDGKVSSFDVYDNTNPSNPVYLYSYYEGNDTDGDGDINEDMIGYTDLNRNYGSYWRDGSGWEDDTQSDIYPGPTLFSEPETQAFRDFALKHRFGMAYSLHSGINATYFTDDETGWAEPSLYWQMVQDYSKILPPSYTEMYLSAIKKSFPYGESPVLAGGWDTWLYFERETIAPITFELYRNYSSIAPGSELPIINTSTHLILEWTEIYGYFNPVSDAINSLWDDVKPAFDYLLENTPRLQITSSVISGGNKAGDQVILSFNCKNLSPRIETLDSIDAYTSDDTIIGNGDVIFANSYRTIDVVITLPNDLQESSYEMKIGNEYTGYVLFNLKESSGNTSLIIGLSIAGVAVVSGSIFGTIFLLRRKK